MHQKNIEVEQKILAKLLKDPLYIYNIDGNIIKGGDFSKSLSRLTYETIKHIVNSSTDDITYIDPVLLKNEFISNNQGFYSKFQKSCDSFLDQLYKVSVPSSNDLKQFLRIILTDSIKEKSINRLDSIKVDVESAKNPFDLVSNIENKIFEFTSNIFEQSEIENLGNEFDRWLIDKQEEVKKGNLAVGIPTGFKNYDEAIGGGLREGTIHVIAGRAKSGKSFLALTVANYVRNDVKIPVLYLDTELDNSYQAIRRCCMISKVSLMDVERGSFFAEQDKINKVKNAKDVINKNQIKYVNIKGWGLDRQVSVIRKFFSKHVGKDSRGKYKPALVILDYLKLMSPRDKERNEKEWESIGYRISAFHDLMGKYNNPMLMFAQQNRQGLERDDDSTIAGSDRIIWFGDSASFFSAKSMEEISSESVQNDSNNSVKPANCRLKVSACRHGPGTPGRKFIGIYADIWDSSLRKNEVCGIIEERAVQTAVIE